MKWIIYELRLGNQVKLWSSQLWTQFLQLCKEAWKIQDFNGVWTRDLVIPVINCRYSMFSASEELGLESHGKHQATPVLPLNSFTTPQVP